MVLMLRGELLFDLNLEMAQQSNQFNANIKVALEAPRTVPSLQNYFFYIVGQQSKN